MISAAGVHKRFGPVTAVDGLAFQIDRGEVVGFLGPNGAGKTTTLRMLTGTLQPDAGQVMLDGRSIGDDITAAKRRIGYLPESNPLYEDALVCDYLEYAATLRGLQGSAMRTAVRIAADETGLDAVFYRPIGEASKGFRQRIGLAAAILHRPDILVLDEPTEGLDPNQRVEIRRLIAELGRERTVLLSTHVMQEVEAMCNRVIIIARGRLVADGNVATLLAGGHDASTYIVEAAGAGIGAALTSLPGVDSHTEEAVDGRVRVRLSVRGGGELRPRIFAMARDNGWELWELHRERVSLEQVFHQLTADAPAAAPGEEPAS
ncbi:MAG: ABC transporter ATP-binding protein [Gemmatimonadetes bacterium]|nr:ABC transporter ATP-binding protein [Gemmatimonadota bacterium]